MSEVFLKIVNMSISAGWMVLAILVLRLLLKKAPRWAHVLLWGFVAVRLICPFSIESALSLIPSNQTISPEIMMDRTPEISTGIESLDRVVNPVISTSFAPEPVASANPLQILIPLAANLWLLGVVVMIGYTAISYLLLHRKLRMAVILRGNIFQCETVQSPFVLGTFKPKIYLPYTLGGQDLEHVVAHEQAHISRKDHWWKPLGFLLLTVYWFNPLMWVAYILLCRDIELACDEKVIARLGNEQRAEYTQALVACSVKRFQIAACPLAFGEVGVKERVRSIMNYHKPAFWVVVTAIVLCAVVAVCFLTDPNPSREFAMNGNNVADLDPEAIVERILDIEDLKYSNVYMNSDNFDLHVDSDFNWMNSQAVRYFFGNSDTTYSSQLRIYPEDETYFLTEPSEWTEQERIFLLRHYLDAVKYLPQHEIRQMIPADQYTITHIDGGMPADYDRVITYSPAGVQELDGWLIHLELQPGTRGTADDVIHLFYGDGQPKLDSNVIRWIDDEEEDVYQMTEATATLPAFEGVTFYFYAPGMITAEDETGQTELIQGMPVRNAYFSDLTGDGYPEICATVSFGSGLVDTHVVVYDYANRQEYTLWDRGIFDYYLRLEDGKLLCEQRAFQNGGIYEGELLASGELLLADAGGGEGKRLIIASADVKEYIVSIVDRAEAERLPTDEAVEVFWKDAAFTYSFPSIRSHLVMVTYYDGTSEDIISALEAGRVSIHDLDRFGIHYYAEPNVLPMDPVRTNLKGLVNGYLFVPINGATYRYLITDPNPKNVTADLLLDTFADETDIEGIAWEVYSLKEYPDMTRLLMVSGTNSAILCEYAPSLHGEEEAMEAARDAGHVIVEDGRITGNRDVWLDFYEATLRGTPGFINVAYYITSTQDAPALYLHELSYDGETFVLRTEADLKVYEYLMKYTVSGTPLETSGDHQTIDHYVLTHDDTVTWDALWNGLTSSASGAYIDHYTICADQH